MVNSCYMFSVSSSSQWNPSWHIHTYILQPHRVGSEGGGYLPAPRHPAVTGTSERGWLQVAQGLCACCHPRRQRACQSHQTALQGGGRVRKAVATARCGYCSV